MDKITETLYRKMTFDREAFDEKARTVPASLSSEKEAKQFFGTEILDHGEDSINLERAADGLPLLWMHDWKQPIGIIENVKAAGGKLRGLLRFSNNPKATEIWNDVKDGFLRSMSIGYTIEDFKEIPGGIRAIRWTPYEASVLPVPEDHTVGINRSKEDITVDKDKQKGGDAAPGDDKDLNVIDFKAARERGLEEGKTLGQKELIKNIDEIERVFSRYPGAEYQELKRECIMRMMTPAQASTKLLEMLGGDAAPISGDTEQHQRMQGNGQGGTQRAHIQPGKDALEKYAEGATLALQHRALLVTDKDELKRARENEFYGMTLLEIARRSLQLQGVNTAGMDRMTVVGQAFTRQGTISHGSSDFPNILANTANKAMLKGWMETAETWMAWAQRGTLTDFKQADRPVLSEFNNLDEIPPSGEYKYGTIGDRKELIKLLTYGKLFSINRQAIINDDLNAFTMIPRKMGRAGSRKVGDLAYGVITGNPVLNQDGVALFAAGHNNLGTAGIVSIATLDEMRVAMALQSDQSDSTHGSNITPKYILVPVSKATAAETVIAQTYDPAGAGALTPNPFQNKLQVISDPRLDAASADAWYGLADPSQGDTIEVAFLDGNDQPFMEQQDGWTVDGVSYKVRIDAAASALDFRGAFTNPGV